MAYGVFLSPSFLDPILFYLHSYWPRWAENHLQKSVDLCYIVQEKHVQVCTIFCWHQHIPCAWKFKYQIDKFCLWFSDCENDILQYAWTYKLLEFCCSTPGVSLSHSDKRRCSFAVHIHVASTLCAESASLVQEFWHIHVCTCYLLGSPA